jgi:glycine betaine/proline transport system ATP-binding protein
MKDGEIVQLGLPEEILTNPATEYVKRFVADVDSAKVRLAESVMVAPKEVAYESEGPRVVLRRMKNAGLSTIFVLDEERRLVGLADVDAIAALAERGAPELRAVVERTAPRVRRQTCLRDILPFFVDRQIPLAVTDEAGRLVGVITRGTLIAGLAASARAGQEARPLDLGPSMEREEVLT